MSNDSWIEYAITYLEMAERPTWPHSSSPAGRPVMLLRAEEPPARWFLHLYDSVGADHEWTDWHRRPAEELKAFVSDPDVAIYTAFLQGWSAGFFMLDWREERVCDLAYFGLTPEARGRGIGKWLLQTAILTGWERDGVTKMTVNTCSLDSPYALPLYQKMGFQPVRREEARRERAASEPLQ